MMYSICIAVIKRPVSLALLACLVIALSPLADAAEGLARISATQVAAGGEHTCALTAGDDTVYCWGDNTYGQLGDGTTERRDTPVKVLIQGNGRVMQLALGLDFSCALMENGTVQCWGHNNLGQLGDGFTIDRHLPQINGATYIAAITARGYHTCALHIAGQVVCWGNNTFGELGNGTSGNYSSSVSPVSGLYTGVVAISAGYNHTCALRTDGTVVCWGRNADGQLGTGDNADYHTPIQAQIGTKVAALASGAYHTCVLTTHGAVRCFGFNGDGELGNGGGPSTNLPVAVDGLDQGVRVLAGGSYHTCVIDHAGVQKCWGEGSFGQLGAGTGMYADSPIPVAVAGLPAPSFGIAIGANHTCARDQVGAISCWGAGGAGQLGYNRTGTPLDDAKPESVIAFSAIDVITLAAGGYQTCVTTQAGRAMCWGDNAAGQLGDGSTTNRPSPGTVLFSPSSLDVFNVSVGAGQNHSCAVDNTGLVRCWGENAYGQLGNGTTTTMPSPIPSMVTNLTDATAVAGGDKHTCALLNSGAVKCWGYNAAGRLGDGSGASSPVPVTVLGIADAIAIAVGSEYSCAVLAGGTIKCWGLNDHGQLGDGTIFNRLAPVTVSGIDDAIAIAAGLLHTCALRSNGGVACWGFNEWGALGDGSHDDSLVPVAVTSLGAAATAIGLGRQHSCAALVSGQLKCWGRNDSGELGDFTFDSSPVPVTVSDIAGVIAIDGGNKHTCAVTDVGVIRCWGLNNDGQLGQGQASVEQVFPGNTTFRGQSIDIDFPRTLGINAQVGLSGSSSSGTLLAFGTWTPDICSVSGNTLVVNAATASGVCGVRAYTNYIGYPGYLSAPEQHILIRIGDAIFDAAFE